MAKPVSFGQVTIADNTAKSDGRPESASMEVPITTITPANQAATVTAWGNLLTAFAGVTLGRYIKNTLTLARDVTGAQIPATDPLAQRENKWLCRYHDATTFEQFVASLPTADLSLHIANSEFVDLTAGAGLAVKTAWEAVVVSPSDAAHAVVLDSMQFVGRNT